MGRRTAALTKGITAGITGRLRGSQADCSELSEAKAPAAGRLHSAEAPGDDGDVNGNHFRKWFGQGVLLTMKVNTDSQSVLPAMVTLTWKPSDRGGK